MADHEKAIEYTESDRGRREEIHRREEETPTRPQKANQRSEAQDNELNYRQELQQNGGGRAATMLLILHPAGVLANHMGSTRFSEYWALSHACNPTITGPLCA